MFQSLDLQAQDCERKLKIAREKYIDGHLRDIPTLLNGCLNNGFTPKQRENAYELMVLSHLFLDDNEGAENNLIKLLTANPDYRPSPLDPPEYIYFFNNFRVDPVFGYGFILGPNFTLLKDVEYLTVGSSKLLDVTSNGGLGLGGMFAFDMKIIKKVELNVNFGFSSKRFKIKEELYTATLEGGHFNTIQSTERQFWMDIPVTIKYGIKSNRNFYAYIQGGVAFHKLLGDKLELTRAIVEGRIVDGPAVPILADPNHVSLRKNEHYSLIVGAGLKYKVAMGLYAVVDLKYYSGLTQLANKEAAINERPVLNYKYGYADNYFNQSTLSLSFGIAKMIYKPKRIKRGGKLIQE